MDTTERTGQFGNTGNYSIAHVCDRCGRDVDLRSLPCAHLLCPKCRTGSDGSEMCRLCLEDGEP